MQAKYARASGIAALLAFGLMSSALAYLFFGDTAVAQSIRLSRIQTYNEALSPKLAADPRYRALKVGAATTNSGGVILVQGTLGTDADLRELRALIASTDPPAHVDYRCVIVTR